jgi:PAS domain S-box-containing protein
MPPIKQSKNGEKPAIILIVDDTPENLRVLSEMLRQKGYSTRPVPSGRLALRAMAIEPPDLILLDINMPVMNGYEVCQAIQADPQLKHIPVIFISAYAEILDKVRAFSLGGVDYITKPFQIDEVYARIETHLNIHRLHIELEKSERSYRFLTGHMNDWVWSADLSGRWTFLSPSLRNLLGYAREELLGQPLGEILPAEVAGRLLDYLATSPDPGQAGSREPFQFVAELVGIDRVPVLAEFAVNWMLDEGGKSFGIVGITRDITGRQAAEKKIQAQELALALLNERERMGRELHDSVGQVLSFVNTQAQVIQDMISQGNAAAAVAALAQLSLVANDANTDIRDYILNTKSSRIDAGFFDAIRSFLDKYTVMSGIQTVLSLPPAEEFSENILSSQAKIQLLRIIQEALTNARKYSQAKIVQVILTHTGTSIQAMVIDDGVGFDPEASQRKPGMHFGLGIMRERAAEVGGELQIRSAPGRGVQIIVQFPVVKATHIALQANKFFLVDDHPLILEGVKNLLNMHGVEVIGAAKSGEEAIGSVGSLRPNVVLMDLNLPGMDGIEAARWIKKNLPDTLVIFLTLAMSDRDITRAIQAGASGYLLKNQDPEQFLTLLERFVNGEVVMAPEIMNRILYSVARKQPGATPDEAAATLLAAGLTPQQVEILRDVVLGKEYKQIAAERSISPHTVKYHFNQILDALKLTSRSEALAYSFQIGLVKGRRLGDN